MPLRSIALVDDNPVERDLRARLLRGAGFELRPIEGSFGTIDSLLSAIGDREDGVVCDNRLQMNNYARFFGAEVVARLYDNQVPVVLFSEFTSGESLIAIRRFRRKIPVLLLKADANPSRVVQGLADCATEYTSGLLPNRQPCRTLVRVESIAGPYDDDNTIVTGRVLTWNPGEDVTFPAALVPAHLRSTLRPGVRYVTQVNTAAECNQDLFLESFELAPEPISEEWFERPRRS